MMNRFNMNLCRLIIFGLLLLLANACQESNPIDSNSTDEPAIYNGSELTFLRFADSSPSLEKVRTKSKWVSRSDGDSIQLNHGNASAGKGGVIYGVDQNDPSNIYLIDAGGLDSPALQGQLAFKTRAIAVHPESGKIYYLSSTTVEEDESEGYRVGLWDPQTNTNFMLPAVNSLIPGHKLAFSADGVLYGVARRDSDEIYTINIQTGEWSLHDVLNMSVGASGDMAFGPDGKLYNVRNRQELAKLQLVDLNSRSVTTIGEISGLGDDFSIEGLAFGSDAKAYINRSDGNIYQLDLSTAQATLVGSSAIDGLNDLASAHFEAELTYAKISLTILPYSIEQDTEISLSMETSELTGGVAVTFQPHGTIFNPPAVLNVVAHGVDFDGVDPSDVDIYYDNQETGEWELMPRENIIIDVEAGTIQVFNALLPHFSRYALAHG